MKPSLDSLQDYPTDKNYKGRNTERHAVIFEQLLISLPVDREAESGPRSSPIGGESPW